MEDTTDVRAAFAALPPDQRKLILRSMQKSLLKASMLAPVTLPARVPARVPVRSNLAHFEGR
jgi:hypothetical protein